MAPSWTWSKLQAFAAPVSLRRALDHITMDRVTLHHAGESIAGRVGAFDVSADPATGGGTCSCEQPQPCAHVVALLAAASALKPEAAPPEVRAARRPAFGPHDPPVPVPAFPETVNDYEIPADALSETQRAAVESVGAVRKSSLLYSLPREQADLLAARLEAAGTGLATYTRRPYVRLRASLRKGMHDVAHLVGTETPGMHLRSVLDAHGYRAIRKPKSLVHEYEGPANRLHLLAEALAAHGTGVVLAEGAPPSFEPLAPPPPTTSRTRAPAMPIVFSKRRFDWWTPREGLNPLALAIVARHGTPLESGYRLSMDAVRSVERELTAAGLHASRVEEAPPGRATTEVTSTEGVAGVLIVAPHERALAALTAHGYAHTGTPGLHHGPAANLPALAMALAQVGFHLSPGPGGWPPIPEPTEDALHTLFADDPRLPLARHATLTNPMDGRVRLTLEPQGALLPRTLRIDLYRMGWLQSDGLVSALPEDAGRLVAQLRESGLDTRWPKPETSEWRLASVRYNERARREGGGTLIHLKGPIPLGRMGGVDPGEEAERIAAIVRGMEGALKRHHPEARPLAHGALPGVWSVNGGAGAFLLEAARRGASVTSAQGLTPIPLGRGVVLVDTACLPPRLTEYRRSTPEETARRPVVTPEIENVVRRMVPEGLEVDEDRGHYLIPSTRMASLIAALKELGAKVLHRRLAPKGKRYQRWERELPEDFEATGARPRLRESYRGRFEGAIPRLRPECTLDPHQREGVAFILHHEYNCLLADEMGLGKTLTSIAAAQFLPGRILVVCPASARAVWKQEVLGWTTERVRVLEPGERSEDALADLKRTSPKYVVVAYSGLAKFAESLATLDFDLVILDESHYVKSRSAQRTRLVQEHLARIPKRLILSGTPVMNEPRELRTQLAFIHPNEWSDAAWFKRRFYEPWKQGTPEVREQVLARLREYLEGVMLRREKRVALPDLPDKHLHVRRLALPPDARRAYDDEEDSFRDYIQENEETALSSDMGLTAGRLERLKQIALVGKLPLIIDDVKRLLNEGEKVVVFCHYREPIRALAQELADHGVLTLTGSTRADERGALVQRFQKDPSIRVFVGQTLAAGISITLTSARHAIFCDLEWNPAVHRQAMDRVHRKTQTRPVEVHFHIAEDTIEETIAEVLEEKTEMMDQLLEGRKNSTLGLRDKEVAQREVALRLLSRRRRSAATADEDDDA